MASEALATCLEEAGLIDLQMRTCYVDFAQAEDTRLNRNWRAAIEAVGGRESVGGQSLIEAQRAWIAYRDVACDYYTALDNPGTLDRLQAQICYAELVTRRADEFAMIAKNFRSGD